MLKEIAVGITRALTRLSNPSIQMVNSLYYASLQILCQFLLRDQKSDELSSNFIAINHKWVLEGINQYKVTAHVEYNYLPIQDQRFFLFLLFLHFFFTRDINYCSLCNPWMHGLLFWKNASEVGAMYFDLTIYKAFDSVPHWQVIAQLETTGLNPYLTVLSGVPKGSVLGPSSLCTSMTSHWNWSSEVESFNTYLG